MKEGSLEYFNFPSSFEFSETKNSGIPESHCNRKSKLHQRGMVEHLDRHKS